MLTFLSHTVSRWLAISLKPARWEAWSRLYPKYLLGITGVLWVVALAWIFGWTPNDYQQGVYFKILYLHVPAAWFSVLLYALMALMGALYLIGKSPMAALLARSMAGVGLVLSLVCLGTGALWGKPMWGAYWVWDARLTSMALLALLYVGFIALWDALDQPIVRWKMTSILALFGSLNVPIIKWSVTWWATLHQPATFFRASGSSMHPSMLPGLVLMGIAMLTYCAAAILLSYHYHSVKQKTAIRLQEAV